MTKAKEFKLWLKYDDEPSPVSETYCTGSFFGGGDDLLVFCFSLGDFFDFLTGSSSESAHKRKMCCE